MTLTANRKKWKRYIEEKLKKARMGRIMRKNSELLALMIAATVRMYSDMSFDLSSMAESMKDIMADPVFQHLASDPRAVAEYLQSPGTVIKASRHMKHLFLESLEQTEQLTQNWFGPDGDNSFRQEEPQYTDLDDGTRLKAETSSELGEDWVNVSKVEEENPSKKIKEPQKKEKPSKKTPEEKTMKAMDEILASGETKQEKTPSGKKGRKVNTAAEQAQPAEKETEDEPDAATKEGIEKELEKDDWVVTF